MASVLQIPFTPVEAVTEVLHGVKITDSYRWLEDQHSLQTQQWLGEQTAYTRSYLDSLPGREHIQKRVEELLAVESITEPWKLDNRFFYMKRSPHRQQAVICMREGQDGREEIVLVDPERIAQGSFVNLRILSVSKDATLLAYGIGQGGDPSYAAQVLNVTRNEVLPDRLPAGIGYGLVFAHDGQGFYYSHEFTNSDGPHRRAVYLHRFQSRLADDIEVFVAGDEPTLHLELYGSGDGRFLVYRVIRNYDPPTYEVYVQDLFAGTAARRVLAQVGESFTPVFIGSKLFALTDWDAANLRVVMTDLADQDDTKWSTIVKESQHCITNIAAVCGLLCVSRIRNIFTCLEIFDQSGNQREQVPCPAGGSIRMFYRPIESDTVFYEFSSFSSSPTILAYSPSKTDQRVWASAHTTIKSRDVKQLSFKSKDGADIPLFLVMPEGCRSSTPSPLFLTGYGGFGSSRTPQYNAYSSFLVEHGFAFALANLRGGGEFGDEWHRAGKRHNRQCAIDDFISAAEWLIAEGYTVPEKLAIGGGSNGGLLVGAALTQRPDLFRVVVSVGPLLDMLRYHLFDAAHYFIDEYGCAENSGDFPHLLAYSPYHNVENGVSYPAVLLVSGNLDRCCNPMHARKMAARLQEASSSGRPILLDCRPEWGHMAGQPLTRRIEALTDRLLFICHEIGVDVS
jgi:prolyl oligopeptidase